MSNNKDFMNIFEVAPPKIKYSKYAHSLDRIFKANSLSSLRYNLLNPKKSNTKEFLEEMKSADIMNEKQNTYEKALLLQNQTFKFQQISNANNKKPLTLSLLNNSKNTEENKITEHNSVLTTSGLSNKKKNGKPLDILLESSPSPGKYNPNYDSVYKRSPQVVFITPKEKSKEIKLKFNQEAKQIINNTNHNVDQKVFSINKGQEILNSTKSNEEQKDQQDVVNAKLNNKNHVLKFSQYSMRKDFALKSWQIPVLTYVEPFDYLRKNKGMDFSKMKEREETLITNNSSLCNPSICYYQPNFDYILKKSPLLVKYISKEEKKSSNKKYLINKLWNNYEVTSDYKLVDLKSFVEEKK